MMFSAATASAGDLTVSESTLEGMGLAGMQQMSDEDGLAVRGMGLFDDLGFGGGFEMPDGFGDGGIPSEFQLGNALGIMLNNEIEAQGLGDLGLPANLGIPADLGFGGFGGFGF